jgi:hypothetical protein
LIDSFEPGAHLFPNSLAMSTGSLFAGWMMHKTGKYKLLNLIFGAFPFLGVIGIYLINENSGFIQSWFSIVRASRREICVSFLIVPSNTDASGIW